MLIVFFIRAENIKKKRSCWDPWEKTHFKGWIGCSVSTMRSCRSELVGQQRDPFCQQISPYCCWLALVYVTLKCSRPTLRKGRGKKRWLEKKKGSNNNKTCCTKRCVNSSESEASRKGTWKYILSYHTLCNSCHPTPQSHPPNLPLNLSTHLPLSHSPESGEKNARCPSCRAHILSSPHVAFL